MNKNTLLVIFAILFQLIIQCLGLWVVSILYARDSPKALPQFYIALWFMWNIFWLGISETIFSIITAPTHE